MELVRLMMKALKVVMGVSGVALLLMGTGLERVQDLGYAFTLIGLTALIFGSAYATHNYCAKWYEAELARQFYVQQKRNSRSQ